MRHARIVFAVHDEQRPRDAFGIRQRRDAPQECAHVEIAFIAVLRAALVLPVGRGIGQES